KWEANSSFWEDPNHNRLLDDGPPIYGTAPATNAYGKTNGIYYATVTLFGSDQRIIWVDQTDFRTDFSKFYDGIESLAPYFTPAGSPATPYSAGSLIATVDASHIAVGTGAVSLVASSAT